MDLFRTIRKLERLLKKYLKERGFNITTFSFGVTDIDPKYLAVWIQTLTDAERNVLEKDKELKKKFKAILSEIDYPKAAHKHIRLTIESEETVKRDFDGNWWYRIK